MAPETLQVVGAGATIDGGAWSSTLLQADMLVQQFEACAATYKALDNRANLNKKKQFCAGRRPGVAGVSRMCAYFVRSSCVFIFVSCGYFC